MTAQGNRARQALERLEDALRATNHPLLGALQPGLDEDAITQTMAPTGLVLPDQAAALWRWRDGVASWFTADTTRVPDREMLPGGCLLLPLERAVHWYLWHRHNFPWGDRDDLSPAWFPVALQGAGFLWVDCGGDAGARLISWFTADYNPADELAARSVPSVARGAEVWAMLLERGIWAVAGSGDTVTMGGRTYTLRDVRPGYGFVRDRDDDLPANWP